MDYKMTPELKEHLQEIMNENSGFITTVISENDMKALVRIRNYFGTHDKTQIDQIAYDVLNRVVKCYVEMNR